jgi:hypothetical protein
MNCSEFDKENPFMSSLITKLIMAIVLVASCFLPSQGSEAGVREDFLQAHKNMKDKKFPCETIPYSNLASDCIRQRMVIDDNCKTVQYRCDNEMKEYHDPKPVLIQRKKYLERIKALESDLTQKTNALREFDNRPAPKDDATIQVVKKLIEINQRETQDLKRAIEELDREANGRYERIDKRIAWAKQCIESRREQQKVFEATSAQAKNETADGFRAERDELVNKWDTSVREHEEPKDQIRRSISTCEDMKNYRP